METGISSSLADEPTSTSAATTGTATTVPTIAALTEPCEIKDVDKPIELAAAFEKVNKQTDMIRTLNEVTEPATPLKIDKSGDAEFLVLSNLKLLVNNGISKNEASLKAVYDQYIGNREVMLLVTDINSLKMEKANADILHKQEIALICRSKVIIDGHQTLIDRILEKGSD
jgi:predicted transglutaminase-like cysteine proteinase